MIAKTEAIPIRISAYGGTSQIVTWLTTDYGKISTAIKGAQRPKRIGGGQYDLGYVCELLFYERENNGLHTFKDCTALEYRRSLRGQWRETATLSYLCLVAGSGTIPAMQNPILYKKMFIALHALEAAAPLQHLMLWFELQVLALHGTAPQLRQCTICRSTPTEPYLLAPRAGGLICSRCNATRLFETHTLPAPALLLLQQLQRLPRPIPSTHSGACQALPTDAIPGLGDFANLWLDVPPHARAVAYQMATLHLHQ